MPCKICERDTGDTRIGVCFTCAESESIVADGTDMYDEPIKPVEGYSPAMAKVRAILVKHGVVARNRKKK